jgi:hypothetical protein
MTSAIREPQQTQRSSPVLDAAVRGRIFRGVFAACSLFAWGCQGNVVETGPTDTSGGADGGRASADASSWEDGSGGPASGGDGSEGTAVDGSSSGPKCGSTPTQLVDFNALATQVGATGIGAMQLAVDSASIYFVFGNGLMRVPIRGGPASTMLPLLPQVGQNCDLIATSTSVLLHHVVGGATNDEQIISVPIQGGQDTILATSSGFISGLATDGHDVYFVDSVGLKSVALTGGSVQLLTNQIGLEPTGLAVVGSNLVVTAGGTGVTDGGTLVTTGGSVVAVPIQGGPPTMLAPPQPNASFPMACGPDICWYTGASPSAMGPAMGPEGSGYIARLAGGNVTTIPAQVYPWSLAFDGSNFFETVGCDVCPGTLVRIAPTGTAQVTMVTAGFAAVDDECAYFSVAEGFDLPSAEDGGIPGSGIYSVSKSYADPSL